MRLNIHTFEDQTSHVANATNVLTLIYLPEAFQLSQALSLANHNWAYNFRVFPHVMYYYFWPLQKPS